jgi:hypothetical protein
MMARYKVDQAVFVAIMLFSIGYLENTPDTLCIMYTSPIIVIVF